MSQLTDGLGTTELATVCGLSPRQIQYTAGKLPQIMAGMPALNWAWSADEVRRWQVAAALSRARTGLEVRREQTTSLVNALRAVWAGPIPRPCRWVTISGGVVSYVDDPEDDMAMGSDSVLMALMPPLWPTEQRRSE